MMWFGMDSLGGKLWDAFPPAGLTGVGKQSNSYKNT